MLLFSQSLVAQTNETENANQRNSTQTTEYSESSSYRPERNYPTKASLKENKKGEKDKKKKTQDKDELKEDDNSLLRKDFSQVNKDAKDDLILVPVSVFSKDGVFITDLKKDEISVFEDGFEKEISFFGVPNIPLHIFLLIDKSPSLTSFQKEIKKSLTKLVYQLKPQDKVLIGYFGEKLKIASPLTTNREETIKELKDEGYLTGTSIYDLVETFEKKHLRDNSEQNIVILITDGVDTTSRIENYESALKIAERSNAIFHSLKIDTFQPLGKSSKKRRINNNGNSILDDILGKIIVPSEEDYKIGEQFLGELAGSTGGGMISVDSDKKNFEKAFEIIGTTIRLQNFIGYQVNKTEKESKRKEIKVRVNRPDLIIRIRDNFYY